MQTDFLAQRTGRNVFVSPCTAKAITYFHRVFLPEEQTYDGRALEFSLDQSLDVIMLLRDAGFVIECVSAVAS